MHLGDDIGLLISNIARKNSKDTVALSKLLTLLEVEGVQALKNKALLSPSNFALRIGITGPPEAGKSTLIAGLIREFRDKKLSVGVLAVDPSSPFTKGAILGDRLRYHEHFNDPDVFIRSIGSRGSLGGLSASTYLMARAFDLFGFDITLVETVGVGQTELEIMHVADQVVVVVVPEFGDSIQAMKAGLLEIADYFVVNKSDRPGSEIMMKSLEEWAREVPVLKTIATEKQGIRDLAERLLKSKTQSEIEKHREDPIRLQAEARALLRFELEKKLDIQIHKIRTPTDLLRLI
jgi:LAO/AO transport system kinase